ncbi:hypothetical protein NLX86_10985 [Streptomyces sp. A3M-1-3]|nr:hypothetical protein [Streptomyces sp. A3M-1-3]MCP3818625.1 hypothetical protein [Streptomyces sp. A3M-1-3]
MAWRDVWGRPAVKWPLALLLGGMWWWAALRLAFVPGRTGAVEGAVAAGGWGLSLLPVHCVPRGRAGRAVVRGRGMPGRGRTTRASRLRRSGAGSGPS